MNCQIASGESVPGQAWFVEMNFTVAPFGPAVNFVRGNLCDLNIRMCPVLSCSYIGKIPVHRKQ